MGLDVSVGEYESDEYMSEHLGAYSGYNRWRTCIAKTSGFELDEMYGFGGMIPWTTQPYQMILNHSDCDEGYSLDEIPELLKELLIITHLGVDDYDQSKKLIRLCEHALKVKQPIFFG